MVRDKKNGHENNNTINNNDTSNSNSTTGSKAKNKIRKHDCSHGKLTKMYI